MQFDLNKEQARLTEALSKIIQGEIGETYIPFSKYMALALYHPKYGYYNNLLYKFGSSGDYITAPLVSELFAIGLSKQIKEIFDRGAKHNILEFGAGNGQLMLDILANMKDEVKHYYIMELSSSLAHVQQERLLKEKPEFKDMVTWLTELPKKFDGIVIGNEVLDAIPCDVVHWQDGKIYSKVVSQKSDKFAFTDIKASDNIREVCKNIRQTENGYTSEISLERSGFIKSLSEMLHTGVIILIDYGYGESEYYLPSRKQGTLRGYFRQHQLDDVLMYPGLIDITSSVDFTAIAKTAIDNNLELLGFTTQSSFLINCGITEVLEKKHKKCSDSEYLQLTNQLNRLISPNEMGEIFKVIAFSKNLDHIDYLGFSSSDRSHTL
jgi:SAM-dependent MidA family methyltransferase